MLGRIIHCSATKTHGTLNHDYVTGTWTHGHDYLVSTK